MKTLNVMLKPASSLCNMRCLYCFYADEAANRAVPSYGMMTEETADTIIDRVSETLLSGDAVQYIFQGGEPTLRGLPFFERFAERATAREDLRVSFSLQTNGLLLDDAFCDFFLKYNVLVGVSLDLLPECHDKARPDAKGEGTYNRVCEALSLLKRRGVPFNVLCTLTDAVAARPKQVWPPASETRAVLPMGGSRRPCLPISIFVCLTCGMATTKREERGASSCSMIL